MFDTLKKYKSSLIGLTLVVLLFYAYTAFGPEALPEEYLFSDSNDIEGGKVGEEIIASLNQVRGIKFRTEVFDNPLFKNLVNQYVEVTPEPKNRRNPFEPIGFGVNESGFTATPLTLDQFITGNFSDEVDKTNPASSIFLDEESRRLLEEDALNEENDEVTEENNP